MKKFGIITTALLAILLLTTDVHVNAQQAQPATSSKDPESIYRAAYDAQNAGDVDAFVALFAESAVSLALPPPPDTDGVFVGKEAIRNVTEELVARNIHTDFTDLHVHGDSVTFTALVTEDAFRDIGVFPVEFSGTAVVQNGLIQSEAWHIGKESLARLETAITLQTNKAIIRRGYNEMWSKGNLALADEIHTSDVLDRHTGERGIEGIKQIVTLMRTAFPDMYVTVDSQIAEGDLVVTEVTFHLGAYRGGLQEAFGIPDSAIGKETELHAIDYARLKDGKIVETWGILNDLGFLQKLGFELVTPSE
jgi:predicted ester cyclase/ketosteroid isomerase-like protein